MIPRIALFYSRIRMQIRRIGFATKMALMSLFTVFILSLVLLLLSRVITVPITFYLISIILMVVLIPLVILFIARRALNPLVKVTDLIEHISRGEWGHRVEVHSEDEFGKLSHSLNEMLDELQNTYRALEDRVRDRTQLIRSASEVARNAVSIRDFNRLLIEVVNLISRRFGYYHVGAFLLDELGENVVLRAASSEGGQRMLNRGHSLTVGRVGIVGYVAGSGKPRIASDVGVDSHFFANPDLPHTRSEMALPMLAGDKLVGVLDVQSTQANAFSDDDVLILQTIADQLAVLVENSQLLQDQVKFSYTLHRIIEIYNRLSSETDYPKLLNEIPQIIRDNLNFAGVSLALVEGEEIIVQSSAASEARLKTPVGMSMPLGQGIYGRVIDAKSPLVTVGTPQRTATGVTASLEGSPTTICAPILSSGQVSGALAVTFERYRPGERDIEVLEMLANQVSIALENTKIMEEMQQSLQHVDALLQQQTTGAWDDLFDSMRAIDQGTVVEYGGGQNVMDLPDDAPALATDIELRGEIIGSLNILRKSTDDWTDDDQAILEAVADEVAGALEQARLMEELQRRATQLQTAAEVARDATGLLDLDTLLGRAVNLIRERFDFYHVGVYLLDENGENVIIKEATGDAGEAMKREGFSLPVGVTSVTGYVVQAGTSYVAHDVTQDPHYLPNPLLPDTRTQLGIPLRIGDYVIGAMDVQHTTPHTFSEDDIAVLEILGDQLAVAVQNAKNYEEALHRAKREQAVMDITMKVRSRANIDDMLRTAAKEMQQTLGARRVKIQLAEDMLHPDADGDGASESHRPADDSLDSGESFTEEGAA
jgi:GAF domain-containing protein/HAMP domain-containing protein